MSKLKITRQEDTLANALRVRYVEVIQQYFDGHKHVDLYLPEAKIFVEVNGLQHYTYPSQILADFKRFHFSDGDDRRTFVVTNQLIDTHCDDIANALTLVVRKLKNG